MKGQIHSLGLVVVLASLVTFLLSAALLAPDPALAHSTATSEDVIVVSARATGGTKDLFWVIDLPTERLLVYEMKGQILTLGAARHIHWDLLIPKEISRNGGQVPPVSKVEKDTAKVKSPSIPPRTRRIIAAPGQENAGGRDLLFVLDTGSLRQVIYSYTNGLLKIQAARNIQHDLKLGEWPKGGHDPSVKDVKDQVEGKKIELKGM